MSKDEGMGLLGWLRNRRGGVVGACMVAMAPFIFGGCYGPFPLTRQIYRFNAEVSEDELTKSVVFWVMVIIPVYQVGMLADAVIFNLVEYWTGDQILASGPTMDSNGNVVTFAPAADGEEAVLTVSRDGAVITRQSFVQVSDATFEVRDEAGNVSGKVLRAPDGSISLTDAEGSVVRTLPAETLSSL